MNSRHEAVSCDNCLQTNFEGIRFKCLICYDYDLCERCHTAGATTERHLSTHPMQCILTRSDTDMLYRGEQSSSQDAFTCPHCGCYGFRSAELVQHVTSHHAGETNAVICPICIVQPTGDPNQMIRDLATHMSNEHQNSRRNTIRELRRMIYPSRGASRSTRREVSSRSTRDGPFMTFVSDLEAGGEFDGMQDSLTELLSQLSNQPQRRTNQPSRTHPTQESREERSPSIPHRLLLDNLSDEEEQISDDIKMQKCNFFQDLLLSTITDRKLTMKVTDLSCSSSSSCSSSGSNFGSANAKGTTPPTQKKKNKENNNNNSHSASDNNEPGPV